MMFGRKDKKDDVDDYSAAVTSAKHVARNGDVHAKLNALGRVLDTSRNVSRDTRDRVGREHSYRNPTDR